MITEKDLQEAIAECEGQRNPNVNTCMMLAAFYIIREHMYGGAKELYSYAPPITNKETTSVATYSSNTEFGKMIANINDYDLMSVMDELMTTISVINPRLYSSVIRKLDEFSILHP